MKEPFSSPSFKALRRQMRDGFTLLEIMMVVIIISLLLGAAIHSFSKLPDQAKIVRVRADIDALQTALMTYQGLNGFLPTTGQGLRALVTQPVGDPAPKNWLPSMDKVPTDPWGKEYQYECPGTHNNSKGYDLYSTGGQTGKMIGNWDN